MDWRAARICFVFIDGLGLGPVGPANPLASGCMPLCAALLGSPLVAGLSIRGDDRLAHGIDACMGVPGLPQSATGQTALFTGKNAALLSGGHLPAFPGKKLTAIIHEDNILKRVANAGIPVTFANAYSEAYFRELAEDLRSASATTLSVQSAGIPFRMLEDLVAGQAVYWDITRGVVPARTGRDDIQQVKPEEAAGHLAGLAKEHGLVLYETFMTDMLGHRGRIDEAQVFLSLLDRFLARLAELVMRDGGTLVVTSDHGNIEDCSTRAHTTNPVPLLVFGPLAGEFAAVRTIMDLPEAIWRCISGG